MAFKLAPYNNAMRLGQGFNSFTQQICINDAVLPAEKPLLGPEVPPVPATNDVPDPTRISQIVTYSSRFVDKLSDVTEAMNISATLSVKTGKVGGTAAGGFLDSDKFKTSEINFYIQVKVINQRTVAKEYDQFQKVGTTLPVDKFTEIYGDSFISGWEEGGELNAIISIKVKDKSKTKQIRAELEGKLGTPALSGEIKGKFDSDDLNLETSTETTINVNWSGGGVIKEPNVIWDVNSLTLAAASFPELVARTPQKIYAILTKYTALKSYYEVMGFVSPLDYENAGIYSSMLLDAYMDYKAIWKEIQVLNWEYERGLVDIEESKPPQDIIEHSKYLVECLKEAQKEEEEKRKSEAQRKVTSGSTEDPEPGTSSIASLVAVKKSARPPFKPNIPPTKTYPASLVGLSMARKDCRLEMIKIVNEVDSVAENPLLALEPNRDWVFMSPSIFKKLLPRKKKKESAVHLQSKDENTHPLLYNVPEPFKELEVTASEQIHKASDFQLSHWIGAASVPDKCTYFNDISFLDQAHRMVELHLVYDGMKTVTIKSVYSNGKVVVHGRPIPADTSSSEIQIDQWDFEHEKGNRTLALYAYTTEKKEKGDGDGKFPVLNGMSISGTLKMDSYNPMTSDYDDYPPFMPPLGEDWDVAGFYGSILEGNKGFAQFGVVWGKLDIDKITTNKSSSQDGDVTVIYSAKDLFHQYTNFGKFESVEKVAETHKKKAFRYRFSDYICMAENPEKEFTHTHTKFENFNHLEFLDQNYVMEATTFYACSKYIVGLKVEYTNGKTFHHGITKESPEDSSEKFKKYIFKPRDQETTMVSLVACSEKDDHRGNVCCINIVSNSETILHISKSVETDEVFKNVLLTPPGKGWRVHGFYGRYRVNPDPCFGIGGIQTLGVIWGKNNPQPK